MKALIETQEVYEAKFHKGCFLFQLKKPIDGKEFGVINYETVGRSKLFPLSTGDCISFEAEYQVGPDKAILIKEIL